MPRTTRAALRSMELAEEEAIAAALPLPTTPQKERIPLGEIADNRGMDTNMIDSVEGEPAKQAGKKGRKAKGPKTGNSREKQNQTEKPGAEVLEDDSRSSTSSAADEAREVFMATTQGIRNPNITLPLSNLSFRSDPQTATNDKLQSPSPAIDTAAEKVTCGPMSQFHGEATQLNAANTASEEGSLGPTTERDLQAHRFNARNPDMPDLEDTLNARPMVCTDKDGAKEDAALEQIKSRSPAQRISRIEDSVEALDQLEEEIEKAGQAIAPRTDGVSTLSKRNTSSEVNSGKNALKTGGEQAKNANASQKGPPPKFSDVNKAVKRLSVQGGPKNIKPKENRASLLRQGIKPEVLYRATRAPLNLAKQADPLVESAAGPPKHIISVTGTTASPARRITSVTKAPFQPAKSSKVPTQSSFELPGEVFSRKLKAQREERFKQGEEEKSKKPTFKARPVRLSQAPEVRMTAATKARLSMAKRSSTDKPQNSTKRPSPLASSFSSLSTNKRSSSVTIAKRTSPPADNAAKRGPSRLSVSGEPRIAPTAGDLANQKVKGKEAFARPKNEIAAREKLRKEKEEAAKRARIEAAERGRIASREWAEKQKAKKMSESAAKPSTTA